MPLGAACSALSYWLLLPCFGATRTASALVSGGASALAIPALAAAQVLAGAVLGAAVWTLTHGGFGRLLRALQPWHPTRRPARSAPAVAAALGAALGAPALAAAVAPPTSCAPERHFLGAPGRTAVLMCAFGNVSSLPLLFCASVLHGDAASLAAGHASLFAAGWSPLLWSLGPALLRGGVCGDGGDAAAAPLRAPDERALQLRLTAAAAGARPPPGQLLLPGATPRPPGSPRPLRLGAASRGLPAVALRPAAAALAAVLLRPPVFGVLVGVAVGLAPPLRDALGVVGVGATVSGASSSLPPLPSHHHLAPEVALLAWAARSAWSAANLLAAAALPAGTLVLAAALAAPQPQPQPQQPARGDDALGAPAAGGGGGGGGVAADDSPDRVVLLVRCLLLPALTLAAGAWLDAAGLLPAGAEARFLLLLQACMPPAQNLVLLVSTQPGRARDGAPAMARALLRIYAAAALPVAAWVALAARLLL